MTFYPGRGLHGEAVNLIGGRILHGDYAPGQVLDIDGLGHEVGVSRTVVREAVKVLAAKGLVDARPKRGTFVRPRDDWSLLDPDVLRWSYKEQSDEQFLTNLAEVRAIIEPAVARLAAARRDPTDLVALQTHLKALSDPDVTVADFVAADTSFHRQLLRATHNELLQRMELVIDAGLRARDEFVHNRGSFSDASVSHRAVLDAISAGAEDDAERAMRDLLFQADRDSRVAHGARRSPKKTMRKKENV